MNCLLILGARLAAKKSAGIKKVGYIASHIEADRNFEQWRKSLKIIGGDET